MPKAIIILSLLLSFNAYSYGIVGLKDYGKKKTGLGPSLTKNEVLALYNSSKLVCIKDGGKVLSRNKAFSAKGLKKKDCSFGEKTLAVHKKRGIQVFVIEAHQLPSEMFTK